MVDASRDACWCQVPTSTTVAGHLADAVPEVHDSDEHVRRRKRPLHRGIISA
jgi:hypothetical protein